MPVPSQGLLVPSTAAGPEPSHGKWPHTGHTRAVCAPPPRLLKLPVAQQGEKSVETPCQTQHALTGHDFHNGDGRRGLLRWV